MRKMRTTCADKMDGITEDIQNNFGKIYEHLYTSVQDGKEIRKIIEAIERNISIDSLNDVIKVTVDEVKKAAAALKPGKGDPVYTFSSDYIQTEVLYCQSKIVTFWIISV